MTDTQLDTLQERGLVRVAAVRPELEYLFRHALVQDAAYGSLLKQERRELHGQVGEALEALYPERAGELAPVLAMHFEQAGETEKAIDYYAVAGRHAMEQNAVQEAFGAFDHAATLIDRAPGGATGDAAAAAQRRRRVEVALGRAQAGFAFLSAGEAFDSLERIAVDADQLGDMDLISRVHMINALGRIQAGQSTEDPQVARSLKRITEAGEALGDPSIRAMPLAFVGLSKVFAGPVREGVAALEEAVPLLQQRKDMVGAAFARGGLAVGYAALGDFDKADAATDRARELAQQGDLIAQLDALIMESMVRSSEGKLDQAVPIAQECVDRAEETGASACILASSWVLGDALHRLGRFSDARNVLQRGADVASVIDRMVWRPTLQAWLRSATMALGEAAEGDFDEALATARATGQLIGEAGILGKRAEAEAAKGDIDAANADFAASAALHESMGMRPALARVLFAWGAALRAAGRTPDATSILQRSAGLFDELGLKREALGVRTTLALGSATLAFD